jgi:hypothetical protein
VGTIRNGLSAALELVGAGELEVDDNETGELFDLPDAARPLPPVPGGRPASVGRGGRPKGAKNRSTEEWKRFLLSRYSSPLQGLLEVAARPVEDLARTLQLFAVNPETGDVMRDTQGRERLRPDALITALKLQIDCQAVALPYLHQKQPIAVETKGDTRGVLVIGEIVGSQAMGEGQLPVVWEVEQNQYVIDLQPMLSDGEKSDKAKE